MTLFRLDPYIRFLTIPLGRLLLAGTQGLVAVVTAWAIFRIYPGDRWLGVRLGNYFAPWLFVALLPSLGIALAGRRRWLSGAIMALLVLFLGLYGLVLIPRQSQVYASSTRNQLRVMTFNVNFKNRNAQGIAELIQTQAPDIIAFQEMTPQLAVLLRPRLEATHPYYLVDNSGGSPMTLISRYPLVALPKPRKAHRAQHALVKTPHGEIVIWNVHPNPVVGGGWEKQRASLKRVADDVAEEIRPVIVLGDFNITDQTDNYRLVADQLTDVHWAVGQGFKFTFPDFSRALSFDQPWYIRFLLGIGPLVGIDHILVSQHFVPQKIYVVPKAYHSDHRPVVAELLFQVTADSRP